jgi:hypothetical protein
MVYIYHQMYQNMFFFLLSLFAVVMNFAEYRSAAGKIY